MQDKTMQCLRGLMREHFLTNTQQTTKCICSEVINMHFIQSKMIKKTKQKSSIITLWVPDVRKPYTSEYQH